MPLERRRWITREQVRAEPDTLFIYGDNIERWGYGGQAKEMRGEPNAVGLPTKRSPVVYLSDNDLEEIIRVTEEDRDRLIDHICRGGTVVWPANGIGTGLARLTECAPKIMALYDRLLTALEV